MAVDIRDKVELHALADLPSESYWKFREAVQRGYVVVGKEEGDHDAASQYVRYCRAAGRPYVRVTHHPQSVEVAVDLAFLPAESKTRRLSRAGQQKLVDHLRGTLGADMDDRDIRVGRRYVSVHGVAPEEAEQVAATLFKIVCEAVGRSSKRYGLLHRQGSQATV